MANGRIDDLTTADVSFIESNFLSNVVPDYARARGEIRAHEARRVEEIINSYAKLGQNLADQYGGKFRISYEEDYPALDSKDELIFAKSFQMILKEMGVEADLQVIGGGSDANFFAKEGFNSIILGVGMEKVHTKEEYLDLDQLLITSRAILKYLGKNKKI